MSDHKTINQSVISPFHAGERHLQMETGKRDAMETFGRRVIRPYMPEQHRAFYQQLPFLVVGAVDENGYPWASLIAGEPGFIQSPDDRHLAFNLADTTKDPVIRSLKPDAPVGLLGIELHTRRRNRMNGRVSSLIGNQVTLRVDQAFGNCPQYIQHRDLTFVRDPAKPSSNALTQKFESLDKDAARLIREADSFYVSSYIPQLDNPVVEGVDVSHRGGRPGFVKVEGNTLTIPDFPGNYHFNTLGNFLLNPKAGLVFADFMTGSLLMLTGRVELLQKTEPELAHFVGADRGWRFTLDHGVRIEDALPFRAERGDFSPNSVLSGTWEEAQAQEALEAQRGNWRPFRIAQITQESSVIRSFYLEPADQLPLFPFKAGQFLTVRIPADQPGATLIRNYTISSAPSDPHYRLSIKYEAGGTASRHFHTKLKPGDIIQVKAPNGAFHLDAAEPRPAVLLAGGVGITPMVSMARHVFNEGLRTRHIRPLTIVQATQTTAQRAFHQELQELSQQTNHAIRYLSIISRPASNEAPGHDFNSSGRLTSELLSQILPLGDYDFFLCGPASFMQAMYDNLRKLGVRDNRIHAEAFGPASLQRDTEGAEVVFSPQKDPEAEEAVITFKASGFEQPWTQGGDTLLEVAEAHGVTPDFGCRSGSCGSCATRILEGEVVYRTPPTAHISDGEALICCAVPAKGSKRLTLEL